MVKVKRWRSAHQAWMEGPLWRTRSTPSTNSYFQEVKPLLMILRAIGRFPYHLTENGILPFSMFSIPAMYTMFVYVIISLLSLRTLQVLLDTLEKSKSYSKSLHAFMVITYLAQNFAIPVTYWLQSPKLVRYIDLWSRFQHEYKNEFMEPRLKRLVTYCSVALVPIGVLHSLIGTYVLFHKNFYHSLTFLPVTYSSYLLILIWVFSQHEIRHQVRKLSRLILFEGITKDLQHRCCCWLTISKLTCATGDALGLACGGLCISVFVSFLICVYGNLVTIIDIRKGLHIDWMQLIPVAFTSLFFFLMFDSADRTSREVGKQFTSLIVNMNYSKLDRKTFDEISVFLLSTATYPPVMTFAGFIVVDRLLFVSFVSSTVTFLVVLIQFRNKD